MSVDGFYLVRRDATRPDALFREICAASGLTHASAEARPATCEDIDLAAGPLGLGRAVLRVDAVTPIERPAEHLSERLRALPSLPDPATELEQLTLCYRRTRETSEVWAALESKHTAPVRVAEFIGIDLRRPAIAIGHELDVSMVRGLSGADSRRVLAWWHAVHARTLDACLAKLGEQAVFELDPEQPAVRSSSSPSVSITKDWPSACPVVLVDRPSPALEGLLHGLLEGFGADQAVASFRGRAFDFADVRAWMPLPTLIEGLSLDEPLALDAIEAPEGFSGRYSLSVDPGLGEAPGALLTLAGGPGASLVLAARGGLGEAQKEAIARRWRVSLTPSVG